MHPGPASPISVRHRWPLLLYLTAMPLLTSCGREAPWFAPEAAAGQIVVASIPAGAQIILDGIPTGQATPDTLRDLDPGAHVVRLQLWGWKASPESLQVEVMPGGSDSASFDLLPSEPGPPKVVLLEGFSNVSCSGCPEMAQTLLGLSQLQGHGPERVLLVKYSTDFPQASDPLYQANATDNEARWHAYIPAGMTAAIPILLLDGQTLGEYGIPPELAALTEVVDQALTDDPGLALSVSADVTASEIPVTVTISAARHVDLAGVSLHVALVENPVLFSRPPGTMGETEFHWVMRRFATPATSLESPGPDEDRTITTSLFRNPSWLPGNLAVIAFLQRDAEGRILQAGSSLSERPAGLRSGPRRPPSSSPTSRGASP